MKHRRAALLLVFGMGGLAVGVGCAVGFSPGDYGGDGRTVGGEGGGLTEGGPRALHLFVLAGERDGTDPATSDVFVAPIDDRGDVGRFEVLQPGVYRGGATTANLSGGRLLVAFNRSPRVVEHVTFESGPTGVWQPAIAPQPPVALYASVFSGTSLLALGGVVDGGVIDGSVQLVRNDGIQIASFDGARGTFGALAASPTKLPIPLFGAQVVTYKDFVYLVGGDSGQADQTSKVYVARIDPVAGVGAFAETARIVVPETGQPHVPSGAMLCAGEIEGGRSRFFVAGGSGTDIVLSSPISDADGKLEGWSSGPKLPGVLQRAGCVVFHGAVHLVGGLGGSSRSDRILRSRVGSDGRMAQWELSSGAPLPAARSGVVALVY
jgi:hypothetical protein